MDWQTVRMLGWEIGVAIAIIATLGCLAWLYYADRKATKYDWSRPPEIPPPAEQPPADPPLAIPPTLEVTELWAEYSYRHSHIWRVVFQATAAVVGLSIVPYLDTAARAGALRFILPFVAAALALFAAARIERELRLLKTVKDEYLTRTRTPTPDSDDSDDSRFKLHTLGYLSILFGGSLFHAFAVIIVLGLADPVNSSNPCCIP